MRLALEKHLPNQAQANGIKLSNQAPIIYSIVGDIIKLPVILKPQAKRNQVLGLFNQRLKIAITAPPVDNKANQQLISFIAELLTIKKQQVTIAQGLTTPLKILHLPLMALERLNEILAGVG